MKDRRSQLIFQGSSQLSSIAYGVISLTLITAFVHLYLSFQLTDGSGLIFLLNGVGYLALLAAIYVPIASLARYRGFFCWLLIAYTALTFVLWIFIGARSLTAYLDKVVELALILLIWLEVRRFSE